MSVHQRNGRYVKRCLVINFVDAILDFEYEIFIDNGYCSRQFRMFQNGEPIDCIWLAIHSLGSQIVFNHIRKVCSRRGSPKSELYVGRKVGASLRSAHCLHIQGCIAGWLWRIRTKPSNQLPNVNTFDLAGHSLVPKIAVI